MQVSCVAVEAVTVAVPELSTTVLFAGVVDVPAAVEEPEGTSSAVADDLLAGGLVSEAPESAGDTESEGDNQ